ncbi:MAG: hypothetical protein WCR72_14130 [Bacteroidota bacterium]
MKKAACFYCTIFLVFLTFFAVAQGNTKSKPTPTQQDMDKAMKDAQKMIDQLPPEEKARVNNALKGSNLGLKNKSNSQIDNVTGKSKQARDAFEKLVMIPSSIELKRGETEFFEVSTLTFIGYRQREESYRGTLIDDQLLTSQEHGDYLDQQMKAADKLNPAKPDYSKINPDEIAPATIERHRRERDSEEVRKNHEAELNILVRKDDKEMGNNSPVTPDFIISGWKMNGLPAPVSNQLGQLEGSNHFGIYKAPIVVPLNDIRLVEITCGLIYKETKEKFTLKSQVMLLNEGEFKATIDGKQWESHQLLDKKYIDAAKGKDPAQIAVAEAHYNDGPDTEKGLILLISPGFPNALTIRIKNPKLGANYIDCKTDGIGLLAQGWSAGLNSYIRRPNGTSCQVSNERCNYLNVNITSLNLVTGGLVAGNFSCTLYEDSHDKTEKPCINSIEHKVSGKFALSVVCGPK